MALHDSDSVARRGEQLESIAIVFLAISWVFIALRVWTRTYIISQFGWDDSTMILAGMIFTVYCACILYIESNGGGTHVTNFTQLNNLTKWVIASEATYIVTVLVLKISLAIFFARIIVEQWQMILIYITIAVSAVSSVSAFFYCIFRCGPRIDDYALRQLTDKCTPRNLDRFFAYQHAVVSFLTDCVFLILPFFILWHMNMDRQSKISVGIILALAALGCVCSAIRFQYVDGLTQIEDFFWNAVNVSVWSTIEPGAGILAGCLATLRPLMKRVVNKARSIRSSTSSTVQSSRSMKSNECSSGRKTATGNNSNHSISHQYRKKAGRDPEAPQSELIELRFEANGKGESTDCILPAGRPAS